MPAFPQAGQVLIQPSPQRFAAADVFSFWVTLLVSDAIDANAAFTLWDYRHVEVLL
jgi:hypothetical protein